MKKVDSPSLSLALGILGSAAVVGSASLFYKYKKEKNKAFQVYSSHHPSHQSVVSKTEFTLLTFNDVYEVEPKDGLGGLAEMASLLQQERAKSKHSITTMNGDFMSATIIANITKGKHMIDIFNEMNIDLIVLGNHEFDYTPKETKKRIKESNFPWLGSNVLDPDGRLFEGLLNYKIYEFDGFIVGCFGLSTPESFHLSYPEDTIFADIVETSQRLVTELRGLGADIIVALTHQSLSDDRRLARKVEGIDIILGGHEHSPFTAFEGKTLIHKSGQNAEYLGRFDISLERVKDNHTAVTRVNWIANWKMIANRGFPPEKRTARVIGGYFQKLEEYKTQNLTVTTTMLDSTTEGVRSRETTMGNLVTDLMKEIFHTDVVIVQGGAIRGDSTYQPGTRITKYHLVREFPFANVMDVYKLKGSDLRGALEEGVRYLPTKLGSFPQLSGMKIKVDPSKPPNERIIEASVNGEPLDDKKTYLVASTRFIHNGGDGYQSLRNGESVHHPRVGETINSLLMELLPKKASIGASIEGRIVFV